jgi:2-aminoadipate transaminase
MTNTINFVRGFPSDDAFPREEIVACAETVVLASDPVGLKYGPAHGPARMRDWVAAQHRVQPDQVVLGNGSMGLFDLLCGATLDRGATVFIEEPCYDRVIAILKRHAARIVPIPVGAEGIDIERMTEAALRHSPVFFYCVPDFHNPGGYVYPRENREDVVALARRYGFVIVEDAPYRALRYEGCDVPSFLEMAPDRTFFLTSFSKIIAPGLRAAYAVGDRTVISAVSALAEATYVTPCNFALSVAGEWLNRGLLDAQVARLRAHYRPKRDAMVRALSTHFGDYPFTSPQGGFFASLRLDDILDEAAFRRDAEQQGVDLQMGTAFFVEPKVGAFFRLPFCSTPVEDIERGVATMQDCLTRRR